AFALVYPLVQGRELGWPLWIFGLLALGLVGFGLFLAYERRRGEAPLIEPGLLRNGAYTSGMAVALAFFAAMIGMNLVFSLYCQYGLGFTPLHTGLTLAPLPLGIAFGAPVAFALIARLGRVVIQAGVVINALGMALLAATVAHFGTGVTEWELAPGLLVAGVGMGFVLPPLFDVILAGVADHEVGSASGVLNAVQQFAAAIGIAVFATVFFALRDHGDAAPAAMTGTVLLTIVPLIAALALGFRLPEKPRLEPVVA
ncbi:MAG TPA: MFS transporter, partial [Solirubrobacteraceae bacterium]